MRIEVRIQTFEESVNERGYPEKNNVRTVLEVNDERSEFGVNRLLAIAQTAMKAFQISDTQKKIS